MKLPAFLVLAVGLLILAPSTASAQKKKKNDYLFTISTKYGDIRFVLFDETPVHKENFLQLTLEGTLDSTLFHRVINDFMIQGGDPSTKPGAQQATANGLPKPPTEEGTLPAEIVPQFKHVKGSVAAARMGDRINPERRSSKTQFYIVQNDEGSPHLDGGYTVFGQVVDGLGVVDKIAVQPVARPANRPVEDIYLTVTVEQMKRKKISKLYGYEYPGSKTGKKKSK